MWQVLGHTRIDTTKQIYAGHVPIYTENFAAVMGTAMKGNSISDPQTVADLQRIWDQPNTSRIPYEAAPSTQMRKVSET